MHIVHNFDDGNGLHNIVLSCNEVMQQTNQLVAKTDQYLKNFTATAATDSGTVFNS